MLVGEALHEVDLGPDPDGRARRGRVDGADDEVGRADEVGDLHDLVGALGVHDDQPVGVRGAEGRDVLDA